MAAQLLSDGIFPQHRFALISAVSDVSVFLYPRPFEVPTYATDVFEGLVEKRMHGKSNNRGLGNILQVDLIAGFGDGHITIGARRCDYAHYLGLALSGDEVLNDGSTLAQRRQSALYQKETGMIGCYTIAFPSWGCTLGLTGMVVSNDGYLITKKKCFGDTSTSTDHDRRLHLVASQIRFDYEPDSTCFTSTGSPCPTGQMQALLRDKEGTPVIAEACTFGSKWIGIFLQDHHPELFFHVKCDLPHQQIMDEAAKVSRLEGELEAIPIEDVNRFASILGRKNGEFIFADHHAGGAILLLHHLLGPQSALDRFLPTERLPHAFS